MTKSPMHAYVYLLTLPLLCRRHFQIIQIRKHDEGLVFETLGPFIQGKIRHELDHLYEHVLSKPSVYLNLLLKCKFIIQR